MAKKRKTRRQRKKEQAAALRKRWAGFQARQDMRASAARAYVSKGVLAAAPAEPSGVDLVSARIGRLRSKISLGKVRAKAKAKSRFR